MLALIGIVAAVITLAVVVGSALRAVRATRRSSPHSSG
jgi:hypothetical protein